MEKSDQEIFWHFIRGDLAATEFENWLYQSIAFENLAGREFYLETVSTNFQDAPEVHLLKRKLEAFLREKQPLDCECIAMPNLAVTDMGSELETRVEETLEKVKAFGQARWWLNLYQCRKCSQYWLVAEESRQNDIFCYRRLEEPVAIDIIQKNAWPKCFETLEELYAVGRDNDRSVRWVIDSFESLENHTLVDTVDELIKTRPSISIDEIASLLNIDADLAILIRNKVSEM